VERCGHPTGVTDVKDQRGNRRPTTSRPSWSRISVASARRWPPDIPRQHPCRHSSELPHELTLASRSGAAGPNLEPTAGILATTVPGSGRRVPDLARKRAGRASGTPLFLGTDPSRPAHALSMANPGIRWHDPHLAAESPGPFEGSTSAGNVPASKGEIVTPSPAPPAPRPCTTLYPGRTRDRSRRPGLPHRSGRLLLREPHHERWTTVAISEHGCPSSHRHHRSTLAAGISRPAAGLPAGRPTTTRPPSPSRSGPGGPAEAVTLTRRSRRAGTLVVGASGCACLRAVSSRPYGPAGWRAR